jgi:hypothetical protein
MRRERRREEKKRRKMHKLPAANGRRPFIEIICISQSCYLVCVQVLLRIGLVANNAGSIAERPYVHAHYMAPEDTWTIQEAI